MDILINQALPIEVIDAIARHALEANTSGVSVSNDTHIHLLNDSQANQDIANAILNNYDGLVVTADKTTMNEGDADPVVSCSDVLIVGDSDVGYIVLLDGIEYASGSDTVTAGVASLTLASPVAGTYVIYLYRTVGDYASGSVTITVSPA